MGRATGRNSEPMASIVVEGNPMKLFRKRDHQRCPEPSCDCAMIKIDSDCGDGAVHAVYHAKEGVLALYCADCEGSIGAWRIADDVD
jgi:hypothetical protein